MAQAADPENEQPLLCDDEGAWREAAVVSNQRMLEALRRYYEKVRQ
jgi:hypothetical protein